MFHFDALILSALIASVWLNLYLSADRLVAEAKSRFPTARSATVALVPASPEPAETDDTSPRGASAAQTPAANDRSSSIK